MEFGGRYKVGAPRLKVWEALNDTEVLKASIPGCQRIAWVSATALEAEMGVNLGVAKPVFTGDLILSNVVPAERYTLSGQGRGGLLGMAHASADITLADFGAGTLLVFTASGGASGRIMQLGKALVGSSAQKVIDGFFARFGEAMGADVEPFKTDG
ncbi:SRPBCC domain-containing protein [Pelagibacterium limicola]|uniref:SRPBCC domain-containing protein n=1 Tax=Pelagibacterium limicola TaxID=2791022 RepID=UPI0018AF68D6